MIPELGLIEGFFGLPWTWADRRDAVAFLGFAIGWWLVLIGMVAVLFSAIGFVFEYYRGHFSH